MASEALRAEWRAAETRLLDATEFADETTFAARKGPLGHRSDSGFLFGPGTKEPCNECPNYLTERLSLPIFDSILQWIEVKSKETTLQESGIAASNERRGLWPL